MAEKRIIPYRIISLTPSLTEILFALKSGHRVAGVTDSCDYPAEVKDWPNVACWFDPDLEKLSALKPDLVLGLHTAHANLKPDLEAQGIRVILVNPLTVDEALTDIARIGKILGMHEKSKSLVANLRARLSAVKAGVSTIEKERPAERLSNSGPGRRSFACGRTAVVPVRYHRTGRRTQCQRFDSGSLSEDYFCPAAEMEPAGDI